MSQDQGPANPTGCQHINFNKSLLTGRIVKTYAQAQAYVRLLFCPCKKCHPLRMYAENYPK